MKISNPSDPEVSPLLYPSHAGLPPAHIQVAGFDPLRDEGILYDKLLRQAGVKTRLDVYVRALGRLLMLVRSRLLILYRPYIQVSRCSSWVPSRISDAGHLVPLGARQQDRVEVALGRREVNGATRLYMLN